MLRCFRCKRNLAVAHGGLCATCIQIMNAPFKPPCEPEPTPEEPEQPKPWRPHRKRVYFPNENRVSR
jgi:hypothetical protein